MSPCVIAILQTILGIPRLKEVFRNTLISIKAALTLQLAQLKIQLERLKIISQLYNTFLAGIDSAYSQLVGNLSLSLGADIKLLIENCDEFAATLNIINVNLTSKTKKNKEFDRDRQLDAITKLQNRITQIEASLDEIDTWIDYLS